MYLDYILFAILIVFASGNGESEVEHVYNVITQGIKEANSTKLPSDSFSFKTKNTRPKCYGIYDYVIVGAGSAGAVLASRLSEDPKIKVLLLEAGGHESEFSGIPAIDTWLRNTPFNWNYTTTPQVTACQAYKEEKCIYPRGKGLGGSSILYTLFHTRGNKADYDQWAELGNPGWSFEDVLPFFKKSENFQVPNGDIGYHGIGGNINVEYAKPVVPQVEAFLEANNELGTAYVDYNGKQQLGVSKVQFNTRNGRRDSTGQAYIKPAEGRMNLDILTHSLVTKVLIRKSTKEAHGVLFSHNKILYRAKARREVILSAGVIGSPQLLMLSGIGPKTHLNELRIPVIKDLPVGETTDQVAYYDLYWSTNMTAENQTLLEEVEEYVLRNGYGHLGRASQSGALGFFQTSRATTPGMPNIEIVLVTSFSNDGTASPLSTFKDEYLEAIARVDFSTSFRLVVSLLKPKSRGTIRLKSSCPYDFPLLNLGILSDPEGEDFENLYEGVQIALNMINTTKAFKKINATYIDTTLQSCRQYDYLSKGYWFCQFRQVATHIAHTVGSCKMGPSPAKGAVVDSELKVQGIRNLRVADSSVIPQSVAGHTHWPSVMVGEKLSDILKKEI